MENNISVKHKSIKVKKPKLFNNSYRHSIKQNNYLYERERGRQTETEGERKTQTERQKRITMCRIHAAKKYFGQEEK